MWWYHLHARTLSMYTRGPDEIGCGHAIRDGSLEILHFAGKQMPRYGTNTSVACGVSGCVRAHLCICVCGWCVRAYSQWCVRIDCVSEVESEFALSCGINRRCRLRGFDSSLTAFILARVRTAIVVFMVRGGAC